MQSYSPTVADRSGEFRAAGIVGAAETSANAQKQMGQDIGSAVQSLAGSYVQGQQNKAKAGAFGQFLKMHGETLGVKPEDIAAYAKMPQGQQLQLVDFYTGAPGQQMGRMNYLNRSGQIYGGGGGGGYGGAGGGGGDYVTIP
jgi:hypothetical protein